MTKLMQNLNSNLLCSIDTETTGVDPSQHEILQIAVIPLTEDVVPDKKRLPFLMDMKPLRPETMNPKAMQVNRLKLCDIMVRGLDPNDGAERFVEWFERLNLPFRKQIMPLGCNWPFDSAMIRAWLGTPTYELIFHPHYRDIQPAATLVNDRFGWRGNDFPYQKVNLQYLCTTMGIERTRSHDATDDARVTAEVYRRLIKEFI